MKLHIMYSGKAEGGAQKFAIELARNEFTTSTITDGNLKDVLLAMNLHFLDIQETFDQTLDVLLLSDIRALLFFVRHAKRVKAKRIYFVPHTDKILKIALLVSSICDAYKITILPTTRCQKRQFRKNAWYLVGEIPHSVTENKSLDGILYFGRFEKVKRLQRLIDDYNLSDCPKNGMLTLQGSGSVSLKRYGANVCVNNNWIKSEELDTLLLQNKFNIIYSKTEGLSLSTLEALGRGLIPLFYSVNCCFNYGLRNENLVRGPSHFRDLPNRNFIDNRYILEGLKSDSKSFGFLYG